MNEKTKGEESQENRNEYNICKYNKKTAAVKQLKQQCRMHNLLSENINRLSRGRFRVNPTFTKSYF